MTILSEAQCKALASRSDVALIRWANLVTPESSEAACSVLTVGDLLETVKSLREALEAQVECELLKIRYYQICDLGQAREVGEEDLNYTAIVSAEERAKALRAKALKEAGDGNPE